MVGGLVKFGLLGSVLGDKLKMVSAFIQSMLLLMLLATPSFAENYRVPEATMAEVSSILGERMVATQRMPQDTSIRLLSQVGVPFVRFTVQDGDIGGAPTDNDPSHSAVFDRPHSERAEVRTEGTLDRNSIYEVTFEVRFIQGFRGESETFFQIHTGQKPPLMFFLRDFGRTHLLANLMQGCQSTCGHNDQPEYVSHKTIFSELQMFGGWHRFRLLIDTSNQGSMSIYFNKTILVDEQPVTFPSQHRPSLRLGIYRPGDLIGNATSVVDYRALGITRLGNAP